MTGDSALVLAVNPGATSTKVALFAGTEQQFDTALRHDDALLEEYARRPVLDQLDMRLSQVLGVLDEHGVDVSDLAAVVGRGGLLKPLASGTYRVNAAMLEDLRDAARGEHASNLGAFIAHEVASRVGVPAFVVDPVSVDEMAPVARLSGLAGLERESLSHALNTKAVAKRYSGTRGRSYSSLRLLVAHLGSGISVSAHRDGRMVDVTNAKEEGAFAAERAGNLPVLKLVDLCFSGTVTKQDLERRIFGGGGVYSYLSTRDMEEVLRRVADGDEEARLVVDAMIYQIARELGALAAAALAGRVDAILVTGGMARAESIVQGLVALVEWIAPVHVYPGEDELSALAEGALRVLSGQEDALSY